ncbi:MAG: hypothetical protein ACLR6J_18840 [Parabacteroides merdae]
MAESVEYKHSISATGGTEKVKYYVLGNFIREEGSYKNLENNKYSFQFKLNSEFV